MENSKFITSFALKSRSFRRHKKRLRNIRMWFCQWGQMYRRVKWRIVRPNSTWLVLYARQTSFVGMRLSIQKNKWNRELSVVRTKKSTQNVCFGADSVTIVIKTFPFTHSQFFDTPKIPIWIPCFSVSNYQSDWNLVVLRIEKLRDDKRKPKTRKTKSLAFGAVLRRGDIFFFYYFLFGVSRIDSRENCNA